MGYLGKMAGLFTHERWLFLAVYPPLIAGMLYLSAVLGVKWQGGRPGAPVYEMIGRGPQLFRLAMSGLIGAVTPFCSCTTVPGFAAILELGLGLDTALTFLIASPLIDPAGTLLLIYLFGARLTILYTLGCFVAAMAGGILLGGVFSEAEINPLLYFYQESGEANVTWGEAARQALPIIARFWWVIVLSALLGFLIYDYMPSGLISSISGLPGWLAVPAAALLGAFIYAHAVVLLPAGAALLSRGLTPGVVLAFIASCAGLSPPEAVLLRKIVSMRLLLSFIGFVLLSISLIGMAAVLIGR